MRAALLERLEDTEKIRQIVDARLVGHKADLPPAPGGRSGSEALKLRIVATASTRWPSAHLNMSCGWIFGCRLPVAPGLASGDQIIHRLIGENSGLHVEHRDIDVSPSVRLARRAARRGSRPWHTCGHDVDDRDADFLRTAGRPVVAFAGDAHQTAHGLDHEIIAAASRFARSGRSPWIEQ